MKNRLRGNRMKVVIDITEQDYQLACKYPDALISVYAHAIKNGTLLPKGHGRLIDADEVLNAMDSWDKFGYSCHDMFRLTKDSEKDYISYVRYADMIEAVGNAPTIIGANKKGE